MAPRLLSRSQIVLLLIFGVLVALWFRSGRQTGPPRGARPAAERFPVDRISEILIQRGVVHARIVRRDDGFWLDLPYRDRADDEMVAQSCRAAATLEVTRELPDTGGAAFGLTPPVAVWRCRWTGGEYRIALGDSLPAGGGRYARLGEAPGVVIVDPFIARRFLSPPIRDLHDPSASRIPVGPIDSLVVSTREERIRIVRVRPDLWQIVEPTRCEGSAPDLARAVHALSSDALTEFLGPTDQHDLRSLGLDPPRAVWILIQGTRQESVRIGSPTADQKSVRVIPARREVVALISSENFRTWVDGLTRLRETRLLVGAVDSVSSVTVAGGARERQFLRSHASRWFEVAGRETLAVRGDAMESAVSNLCALRAVEFLPASASVDGRDRIAVSVAYGGGSAERLEIAGATGEEVAVLGPRQPGWCTVPASVRKTWSLWLDRPLRPVSRLAE